MKKAVFVIILFALVSFVMFAAEQQNKLLQSVEMLNYVTTLSHRIKENKVDRFELGKIKDEIYGNIDKTLIDESTLTQFNNLIDSIDQFVLIQRQRERIQYLSEQNKAQAMKNAIPNPVYLLSYVQSANPIKAIVSITAGLASSYLNYSAEKAQGEIALLQQNWELDDKEYTTFENIRLTAFNYMVNIIHEYNMKNEMGLTENAISKFSDLSNEKNLQRRINDLLNSDLAPLYQNANYGPYYILLSSSYYDRAEEYLQSDTVDESLLNSYYQGCIEWYNRYIERDIQIFTKDFDVAKIIPKVVYSAKQVMSDSEYETYALDCLSRLEKETTEENWELRYFAAAVYIQIGSNNPELRIDCYRKAYNLLQINISTLSKEQERMILEYVNPISDEMPANILTKKDKKMYNDMVKLQNEARETQFPPTSESLLLNMDLILWLKTELNTSNNEWDQKFTQVVNDSIWNFSLKKKYGLNYDKTIAGSQIVDKTTKDELLLSFVHELISAPTTLKEVKIPIVLLEDGATLRIKAEKENNDPLVVDVLVSEDNCKIQRPKNSKKNTIASISDANSYLLETVGVVSISGDLRKVKLSDFDTISFIIQYQNRDTVTIQFENKAISKRKKKLDLVSVTIK